MKWAIIVFTLGETTVGLMGVRSPAQTSDFLAPNW